RGKAPGEAWRTRGTSAAALVGIPRRSLGRFPGFGSLTRGFTATPLRGWGLTAARRDARGRRAAPPVGGAPAPPPGRGPGRRAAAAAARGPGGALPEPAAAAGPVACNPGRRPARPAARLRPWPLLLVRRSLPAAERLPPALRRAARPARLRPGGAARLPLGPA